MSQMKERILRTALRLFAQEGYEAVSVSRIAGELGLSKGAMYRHYRDKRDLLDSIVREMERRDAEGAREYALPGADGELCGEAQSAPAEAKTPASQDDAPRHHAGPRSGEAPCTEKATDSWNDAGPRGGETQSAEQESASLTPRRLTDYARAMARYWTQDEFAADFRRMLTLEQYRDPEMARMLRQYLTVGPMEYTAGLLEEMGIAQPRERAAALYGGMYLMICAYDGAEDASGCLRLIDAHLERMRRELEEERRRKNELSAEQKI